MTKKESKQEGGSNQNGQQSPSKSLRRVRKCNEGVIIKSHL